MCETQTCTHIIEKRKQEARSKKQVNVRSK
jgi:hypothetical protein